MAETRTKAATQLIVDDFVKTDAQRLAVVRGQSMAETWRAAISYGLERLQREHLTELAALAGALAGMGIVGPVKQARAVRAMVEQRIRPADLFTGDGEPRKRFPGKL